ncbi:unnamed protein product [Spirodela intermedia]|uniref:tRNA pseudouridine(55) synthase n=1 Tax=Spirodela intermedia TaxID=51605 RepID=A0A7I8IEK5_SPIIN|nr:unnamed protein product [Spirodela intermedia]CAA6656051.1 unnamed protein product [Spirodela intermedia]
MEGLKGDRGSSSPSSARVDALESLPPPHVIHDLLSVGQRYIRRKWSFSPGAQELFIFFSGNRTPQDNCCVCLGILQLTFNHGKECFRSPGGGNPIDDFTVMLSEQIKKEGHQIGGFCLEISIPPVILANERAIWLYMKNKYESEDWFREKCPMDCISVKDALKISISGSLEKNLGVKFGMDSFRIRLIYAHFKTSVDLQTSLAKAQGTNRKKKEMVRHDAEEYNKDVKKECILQEKNESDTAIRRALNDLQDDVFCEHFILPPEKVKESCVLSTQYYRMPIYIGGRYLKFSRKVSQTRWIIDDERMGEASVEEILGSNILLVCKGDSYKFHAAGREDIDVRMLGSGRPFLVEVSNARSVPSSNDICEMAEKINASENRYIKVRNLKLIGSEAWSLMHEGEAEKQKQYAAVVWISRPLTEEDERKINSTENMEITQRTPIRVLHRRSPMDRKRMIHWMTAEKIAGSSQYFLLHLCTQAGTYIKEFVHGDFGRTHPNIGSILGCRAEILQLDVTDVKMDCFD